MYLAADSSLPGVDVFLQYGIVGVVAVIALLAVRYLYKQLQTEYANNLQVALDRAAKAEGKVEDLNKYIFDSVMPAVSNNAVVTGEAVKLLGQIQRQQEIDKALRERFGGSSGTNSN